MTKSYRCTTAHTNVNVIDFATASLPLKKVLQRCYTDNWTGDQRHFYKGKDKYI